MTPDASGSPGRAGKLGLIAAIALVMGNMIGSGVFLLPASLAPFGWNAVIGWVATISGTLVLAYVLARLTKAFPEISDTPGFVTVAFGKLPGFLIAWTYAVSVWLGVVTIAVAAISYFSSFFPEIGGIPFGPALAAIAVIWALTFVNLRGVRSAGNFQIVTVVIKLIPLLLVIVLVAAVLVRGEATVIPFEPSEIDVNSVSAAAAITLWALLGFEAAGIAAKRVRDPQVNVPRATMWGTGLTGLLYLLVCSAIAMMLPQDIAAASPAPFATFVERYWSAGPASLVSVFAIVSCIGAINGWILIQGELPRAMAEDGLLPRWFARTDAAGVPRNSLVMGTVIASALALVNGSRSMQGLFEFLLLLANSVVLWFYLAFALAAWKFKVVRPLAAIGALYALWTLWGAGIEASGWSLVLMFAGLPLWWWAQKERRSEGAWQAS